MGDFAELIVGDRWALYRGPVPVHGLHRHSTSSLCTALGEGITVVGPGGDALTAAAVSVPAGAMHLLRAGPTTRVAILVFEPRHGIRPAVTPAVPAHADDLAEWLARASALDIEAGIDTVDGAAPRPHPRDDRIATAIALVREDPSRAVPAREIAARVHLSASRLSAVFAAETGMSLRRYRLWVRLTAAARAVAAGASLADAATAAGFTDAAHLSATARRVLGVSPSQLIGRGVRVSAFSAELAASAPSARR